MLTICECGKQRQFDIERCQQRLHASQIDYIVCEWRVKRAVVLERTEILDKLFQIVP